MIAVRFFSVSSFALRLDYPDYCTYGMMLIVQGRCAYLEKYSVERYTHVFTGFHLQAIPIGDPVLSPPFIVSPWTRTSRGANWYGAVGTMWSASDWQTRTTYRHNFRSASSASVMGIARLDVDVDEDEDGVPQRDGNRGEQNRHSHFERE